jgi:hypothetical protein
VDREDTSRAKGAGGFPQCRDLARLHQRGCSLEPSNHELGLNEHSLPLADETVDVDLQQVYYDVTLTPLRRLEQNDAMIEFIKAARHARIRRYASTLQILHWLNKSRVDYVVSCGMAAVLHVAAPCPFGSRYPVDFRPQDFSDLDVRSASDGKGRIKRGSQ